ncbi:tRNA (adenosine(37)-N6)-threonylcarbamoyltransferase complex dimerization subunit type 1 TsaB [Flavipsychrobacter stenotrophus]|uniref:tRNA (Adenosine(37)-N6)-threonylcarbamoyltransferase complex dimerization subunit type 1 TsaB n=1 Tax=Flavipsychrobacter stenotrophus TaxID=2077091 RepID=A0A2S7SXZ0_9BACT|nr:tRNA (adenosine(37)-N6)-threonylcarbamoyltransferase complex dimerization subunit type 1 TsaB [Flavipsychrobacter stenotrophus]PQJ11779.1 tRNA (adenosine(37)-N6)-threonylcarbamoyltransferase complex dimerization subunit type 1 TsaB [Flavipsychrobacter stenotrophus]
MKYLLHIDTSGDTSSVSLALDGQLICTRLNSESRNHASAINIMIDAVLAEAGIIMTQLSGIVVCAGPGSYTGLRIGVATAKGLCYALNIPLLLDNKLTLLAYQAYRQLGTKYKMYVPLLLAREREYFISCFDNGFQNTVIAKHIMESELGEYIGNNSDICLISDNFALENHEKYSENIYVHPNVNIDIKEWVFYSFEEYKCNNIVNLSTAEPFYLKQVYTHK